MKKFITFETKHWTLNEIVKHVDNNDIKLDNFVIPEINDKYFIDMILGGYKISATLVQNQDGTLNVLKNNKELYYLIAFYKNLIDYNGKNFTLMDMVLQRMIRTANITVNILDRRSEDIREYLENL